MSELNLDGMAIASGVVETIVSIAVREVEGVAAVGSSAAKGNLRSMLAGKTPVQGIELSVNDESKLEVSVHIDAYFGQVLPEVADRTNTLIITGTNPATEIIKLLDKDEYDLMVIGSRGLSGIKAYLGSVSHKVLNGSKISVLIAK